MFQVLSELKGTTLILKGGTALMLYYGLDRFSEDLDFDSTKKINIMNRLKKSTSPSLYKSNFHIKKDTDTTHRIIIRYKSHDSQSNLKIEVSLRDGDRSIYKPHCINGVNVAPINVIFSQKLNAAHDGCNVRSVVRDLYDLVFIADNFDDHLSKDDKSWFISFSSDPSGNLDRYYPDYLVDDLVNSKIELETLCEKAWEITRKLESSNIAQQVNDYRDTNKNHNNLTPNIP